MLINRSLPGMHTMGAKPITQSHQAQPQAFFAGAKTGNFTMQALKFPNEERVIDFIATVLPFGLALSINKDDRLEGAQLRAQNRAVKQEAQSFQNECRTIVRGVASAFSGKFKTYGSPFNFTITPTLSENKAELVFSIKGPTGSAVTVRHNIKEKSAKGKPAAVHTADLLMLEVASYTRNHRR